MRDLLFFSLEHWDDVWRRNQFLCAGWTRRFPDSRILFVGPPRWVSRHVRSGTLPALRELMWRPIPDHPNIFSTLIPKWLPNPVPGGRWINQQVTLAHLRRMVARAGLRDPLVWVNPYDVAPLARAFARSGIVYDITDDWELAAEGPSAREAIATADREMCALADLTVVCSDALYQSRLDKTRRLFLLPNGVDAKHYANAAAPPAQNRWQRPVFGYTGTLHRWRIDLELVEKLAEAYPQGHVVLVGPIMWSNDGLKRACERYPNIVTTGPVAYSDLPSVMAHFDVCIVPHQQSEFTESLNPIKLWEYLACGKPIVTTDVAGFRDFGHLCCVADDHAGFLEACEGALAEAEVLRRDGPENHGPLLERRAMAARHSWETRLDDLVAEMTRASLLPGYSESTSRNAANGSSNETLPDTRETSAMSTPGA